MEVELWCNGKRTLYTPVMLRILLAIIAPLLLFGCSSKSGAIAEDSTCKKLYEVLQVVSDYTGQPVTSKPSCNRYSKEDFETLLLRLTEEEATREELEIEEYVFKQFGIIPTDYDFAECIRPAFFRQASAFYSPRRKEVILPAWSPTPTQTLIHEAVHVLQDQQLDLAENDALRGFFHDRSLASGALLEGDARMITRQILQKYPYINDDRPTQPFETLPIPDPKCSFPHSLTRLFDFQYEGGLTYWQKLNERYPNASRKEVLRLFPTQTSIILQPEKTFEAPTDEICRGTKGEYARSLGVAMIQEALMTMVPEKRAMSIASDLSFDCYHATAKKVLWTSTWETTQSLTDFLYFVRRMKELSPTLFEGKFSREGVTLTFYGEKAAVSPQVR